MCTAIKSLNGRLLVTVHILYESRGTERLLQLGVHCLQCCHLVPHTLLVISICELHLLDSYGHRQLAAHKSSSSEVEGLREIITKGLGLQIMSISSCM